MGIDTVLASVVTCGLFVYLVYALFYPDRF